MQIILFDYFNFEKYFNKYNDISEDFNFVSQEGHIILSSETGSLILKLNENKLWFLYRQLNNIGKYALYTILTVLLFISYRLYRHQKRSLEGIVDLPSTGFVFFINKFGKLTRTNKIGKTILNITSKSPKRKPFTYYCKTEQAKRIFELIEDALITQSYFQKKINIIIDNDVQEWYCSFIPLHNILGKFSGGILKGIDITEELERKTLTNWAQLAHDMQTNLSTIRLNVEQIESKGESNVLRKDKIIHQVTILMQRIRDIITVGRNDELDNENVNSIEFCNELRYEFDTGMFSNIIFDMKLVDFNFICDKPKMLRAVRNAVENGIKSMKGKQGIICISCRKDIHNIYLTVKDSGEGMDEITKKRILAPFYSSERKEGGYGIGTMIMQRVVELHGGKLIIESKKAEGTEITFQIPDFSRKYLHK